MKNVLIIGGTSGIGRGLVELYNQYGHKVGVVGRRTKLLEEIKSKYKKQVFVETLDVTEELKSVEVYESLISKLGGLDIVINCSGWGEINKEFDNQIDKKTIQTNILGFTNTMNYFTNYFLERDEGIIVNISSIGGIRGGRFVGSYNSSKSYQITFLESLSISLRKLSKNIQITDVRLGPVKTDMLKGEGFFWVSSVKDTCEKIYKGINKGKRIIYNDSRWWFLSKLLSVIPYSFLRV